MHGERRRTQSSARKRWPIEFSTPMRSFASGNHDCASPACLLFPSKSSIENCEVARRDEGRYSVAVSTRLQSMEREHELVSAREPSCVALAMEQHDAAAARNALSRDHVCPRQPRYRLRRRPARVPSASTTCMIEQVQLGAEKYLRELIRCVAVAQRAAQPTVHSAQR